MYRPAHFTWEDPASQLAFCRAHPFATVVATGENGPEAQHLPLLVDHEDGRLVLRGHAAVGDPLWRAAHAMAIFHGPHAYVSAAWYEEPDTVPTWNYLAVHASGPLRVISDPVQVRCCFDRLGAADPQQAQWSQGLSEAMYQRLASAVHWFAIKVERCEGKAKLSQNHQPARRKRVIARLAASPDSSAQATGAAMARTLDGRTPWPAEGES